MISLEYDNKYEVTLVLDKVGALKLRQMLDNLLEGKENHYHLMTEAFGGDELLESEFIKGSSVIHMFRLQYLV